MSLARRGIAQRLAARALAAALLAGILATLAGCGGSLVNGYYLLPAPRTSYLYEEFDWWDDGRWNFDAEDGYPYALDVRGGYFVAAEARQFARTHNPIPTHVEVRTEWQIWSSDGTTVSDNGDTFDIRLVFDTSESGGYAPEGLRVELKVSPGSQDTLTIADDTSGTSVTASAASVAPTQGTLRASFNRIADPPRITAQVHDGGGALLLEAELPVDDGWDRDLNLMIEASGLDTGTRVEARTVDSVYVLDPEGV
ncbi:MAG: hypothetical protein ACOC7V_04635 [Spirochaetota bacterium]